MDNLTHSVVGLGLGALIDRSLAAEPNPNDGRLRSRMLLLIGCLASNFPDLDLVLTPLLRPPLGYLLHHRGHTHTVLAAVGEALLLLVLVWLLWPAARRLLCDSAVARRGAVLAAGVGLLLHIGMDSLNVYGVHPFWPLDPDWYYGSLFQTPGTLYEGSDSRILWRYNALGYTISYICCLRRNFYAKYV